MNPIGIMQGRLSPPLGGRIQSFPVSIWQKEFFLTREAGLDCIEWVYETDTEAVNPLGNDNGIGEIRRVVTDSGVAVGSVCADYYMARRLVSPDGMPEGSAVAHLVWLIGRVAALGGRHIVLPFVDSSSLQSSREVTGLKMVLRSVLPEAEGARVELHLETDLEPQTLAEVLESMNHPLIRANYDIGNSAALGRDPIRELGLIAPWLGSVHVKDRLLGGGTVRLGAGAADFPACFELIMAADFRGAFILQAAREDGLSELELAVRNRKFVEDHLAAATSQVSSDGGLRPE